MNRGLLTMFRRQLRRMFTGEVFQGVGDSQLLDRFVRLRDEAAFAELLERHGPMVLGVCRRVLHDTHLADDAFQSTFLVLFRKAHAIVTQDSVASWLYGVAYRTALRARAGQAKHRAEPQPLDELSQGDATPMNTDLRPVLDEELDHLPEKLRAPLVLCYLEGKSNEEAAQLLGCPFGTVSSRLARGRDQLRERLSRRGLALTSAGLIALLVPRELTAAVPSGLADATRSTLLAAASGQAVSASVAALTEGMIQTMFWKKALVASSILISLVVFGVGSGFLYQSRAGSAFNKPAEATAPVKEPEVKTTIVEKEGLRFTIKPTKAIFTTKETPTFAVTFDGSEGKGPICNYRVFYEDNWTIEVTNLTKKETERLRGRTGAHTDHNRGDKPIEMTFRLPAKVESDEDHRQEYRLTEGRHLLQLNINFTADTAQGSSQNPFRHFDVEVPFVVADGPTIPKEEPPNLGAKVWEKDGLAVTVRPWKPVFALKERPQFYVTLQNNTKKDLAVDTWDGQAVPWSMTVTDLSNNRTTTIVDDGMDKKKRELVFRVLRPKEESRLPFHAHAHTLVKKDGADWPEPFAFAEGKYRLTLSIPYHLNPKVKDDLKGTLGVIASADKQDKIEVDVEFAVSKEERPVEKQPEGTVAKDGLVASVKPCKSVFTNKDSPGFDLTIKNRTGKSIAIERYQIPTPATVTDLKTKKTFTLAEDRDGGPLKPNHIWMDSGRELATTYFPRRRHDGKDYRFAEGEYLIKRDVHVWIDVESDGESGVKSFKKSSTLTVECKFVVSDRQDVKMEPPIAEKDGLTASLTPTKAVFAANEWPTFKLKLKNSSTKSLAIQRYKKLPETAQVLDLQREVEVSLEYDKEGRPPTSDPILLGPGEETTVDYAPYPATVKGKYTFQAGEYRIRINPKVWIDAVVKGKEIVSAEVRAHMYIDAFFTISDK